MATSLSAPPAGSGSAGAGGSAEKPCVPEAEENRDSQSTIVGAEETIWWQALRRQQDQGARNALIHAYLPHARMIAAVYYKRRTHDETGFDDYFQLASVALMESIDRFDPGKGASFKTYSARRMHGAILDGLDALSEKSRQIAVRRKIQGERLASLVEALPRPANQHDGRHERQDKIPKLPGAGATREGILKKGSGAAENQNRHAEQLFRALAEIGIGTALGILLEDTGMMAAKGEEYPLVAGVEVSYFKTTQLQRLRQLLHTAVAQLANAERRVIQAHYLEEISFGEIAQAMGLQRARISQLHRQALEKLRTALSGKPECDLDL